ncbi:alpha/beta hydrolase [Caballeronia arationis]|jgi:pimeloyl-ACP methyl ester carboxylesterase|uniref:Pimeloyl-ACP methyl ester carboxylesterase n=1 Tax=Caballeronia arationis TaxID=1777142 RepID=A0A7Z7IEB1_9BURK|nr:alpha/beta hydrolase [Caballeronia arationis]SAK45937.1 alpha/beta hydrolase [Caballeronia arationis]SOE88372.1 Pimeloyl-ACP methyl ester carboxylesterase [Caballeronia arationis]
MNRPADTTSAASFADLPATATRDGLRVEYRGLNAGRADAPIAVFLHEGLGSIAMWRDWPQSLCDALGLRGIVYSRPGYGRSTPRAADVKWSVDFMHRQADDVLPALLDTLGVDAAERRRMWLIGHSDGGSIALLYAAAFPDALAGVVVLAPHVTVEPMSIEAIGATRHAYQSSGLREKLARYHEDVDSAFFGWNEIWLDPAFRAWDITDELASIMCPLLAIQGEGDEYASMAQIDMIAQRVVQAKLAKLPGCGHSPHRQMPERVNDEIVAFLRGL